MTKFSQVTPNSTPALIDYLMGVTSGNVDFRVTVANLVALIMKSTLLNNPYKFSAYSTTSPSISNTTMKMPFNAKDVDTGSNFDAVTNYRFTVPVSGFYWVQLQGWMGSAGAGTTEYGYVGIYKNGSVIRESDRMNGQGDASRFIRPKTFGLLQLTAGDYLEAYASFVGSRDVVGSSTVSRFEGFLVSAT